MSNPWKTSWNVMTSFALFASSAWLTWDDYSYPGEILFQTSGGMAWLLLFSILWFILAHLFSIFPKRIIFPVLFLVASRTAIGFPLNLWMSNNLACLTISASLTLITGMYFLGSVFHFLGLNRRPWMQWKHSLTMILVGFILGIASLPFGLGGMVASAQNVLGDYTRITFGSVSLIERVFTRDGKKVFLIGMMHIGEQDFYDQLNQRMHGEVDGKRIVLTEGVSDKNNLLPDDFKSGQTYGKWARRLGLMVQNAEEKEMTSRDIEEREKKWAERGIAFLNADIDVSELSEEHQRILVKILESLGSNNLAEILKGPETVTGPELEDLMMEGLLTFRNNRLMEFFNESIKLDIAEIYIPWGAAHLPDIEKRLVEQGFTKISEEIRPVVRFWKR